MKTVELERVPTWVLMAIIWLLATVAHVSTNVILHRGSDWGHYAEFSACYWLGVSVFVLRTDQKSRRKSIPPSTGQLNPYGDYAADSAKKPFWRKVLVWCAGFLLGDIVCAEFGRGWSSWLKCGGGGCLLWYGPGT